MNLVLGFVYDYLNVWASGVWYIDNVKILSISSASIFEHSKSLPFQLFPNPTSGIIHFIPNKPIENATLKITNIMGELLLEKAIVLDTEEINFSSYFPGIYFVHYFQKNKTFIKKLIVY